jgi:hypothetical protein
MYESQVRQILSPFYWNYPVLKYRKEKSQAVKQIVYIEFSLSEFFNGLLLNSNLN